MSGESESRLRWVDCCKGLCIVLVVYGHVSGGLAAAGIVANGSVFDQLRSWVYLFHMPAFFFLSGLFAARALARPLPAVFAARLKTLVYPYVLWTGIYLGVQTAMARYVNNPSDAGRALHLLWEPYGYGLWFLYSLFLVAWLFHLLMLARLPGIAIVALGVALHLASAFNLIAFWPILNQALAYFIYYAAGGLYAETIFLWLAAGGAALWAAQGILLLSAMTALALALGAAREPVALAAAILGIIGAVCLARALAPTFLGPAFACLGFYSLEIYLGHPLFSTATRAMLGKLGVHDAGAYVALGVATGVGLSLGLGVLCRQLKFPYLFRWPAKSRAPVSHRQRDSAAATLGA